MSDLIKIQSEIVAKKDKFNKFGNYNYRSAESIMEAIKPILLKYEAELLLTDDIIQVGDRIYIKSTAKLKIKNDNYVSVAFAREEENKKGMDSMQLTGATASYSRKYALSALFLIDDGQDSDSLNTHGKEEKTEKKATQGQINDLTVYLLALGKIKEDEKHQVSKLTYTQAEEKIKQYKPQYEELCTQKK